jgi:hypothetical protein
MNPLLSARNAAVCSLHAILIGQKKSQETRC